MRSFIAMLGVVVVLGLASPAQAQLRGMDLTQSTSSQLNDSGAGFLMKALFNPRYFDMGHTFELSSGSGIGSLAMYTNSLQWSFNNRLSARADVSVAYSPFSKNVAGFEGSPFDNGASVFLRSAELNYAPSDKVRLHLSYNRSPYGYYAGPFGSYRHGPRFQ